MAGGNSFLTYLKAAFLNRWNLLFFCAAQTLGLIAGKPDVIGPLVLAVELVYLSVISMNERYQTLIDAQEGRSARDAAAPSPDRSAMDLLRELSLDDQQRFQRLRNQCLELRRVAEGVKGRGGEQPSPVVTDIQIENINRLLWIYLKLLYSKKSLETFFRTIREKDLQEEFARVQSRLAALGPEVEDTTHEVRQRMSLMDTHRTLDMRLKNYLAARENYDILQLELERLHSKISGIAEMGIHRQDTEQITSEIDVVSTSVMQTEKTFHELESLTGYSFGDGETPSLLTPGGKREREKV